MRHQEEREKAEARAALVQVCQGGPAGEPAPHMPLCSCWG